jgi:autotransporter-associated beta strand protein
LKFLFKFVFFLCPIFVFSQTSRNVYWQTWNQIDPLWAGDTDPHSAAANSTLTLKGTNAAGASLAALYEGSDGVSDDGDLIELGYFDTGTAANTGTSSSGGLFKGEWVALTDTTTIGHKHYSGWESTPGEFYFQTTLSNGNGDSGNDLIAKNNPTQGGAYEFDDDTANLVQSIDRLDAAGSNARLGIRFYDNPSKSGSRYNTMLSDNWTWSATQNLGGGSDVFLSLHASNGSANGDVKFEFDNSDGNGLGAKVGTSDTAVGTDDYVASVTYRAANADIDLDTIGSSVLSGLSGSGDLMGGDNGDSILTIHSSAGNTGSDAYEFTGNIYESNSAHSDLSVLKTGTGDQILSGNINLEASSGDEGYLNLQQGGLTLNPGSGETQIIEYLKGASGTTLTLDSTGAGTLTLGFAETHTSSEATFEGNVALTGSGASNIIQVSSGTDAGDYSNEQVISGIISGSEKLTKSGVGRLKLSGDNTFSGGMDINDGTVVAGHDDAIGSGTITINKGKLEVSSTFSVSETVQGGTDATKKSMIGGDGTVGSITIGSGSGEIDVLSPGQGISTSLTETSGLSKKQVALGNGTADDAIGSFTATTLSLQGGGVYDWEMQDFDGTTGGTDYDVMNFTNLSFGSSSDRFTINIMGIQSSDGTEGAPDNLASIWGKSRQETNGFKFLTDGGGSGGGITWGAWNAGNINDYFEFRYDDLAYNISNNGQYNNWGQQWSVHYDSGDFYLQFSAVPEPSTYIMVTGLFMLPGYRWIRRFRKGLNPKQELKDEV